MCSRCAAGIRANDAAGRAVACAHAMVERPGDFLALDAATRRNLEITETLQGDAAPTLCSLLDVCVTGAGSRLLRLWLTGPLRMQDVAAARHDAIAEFGSAPRLQREISLALQPMVDIERIASRIALASARPRELAGLRDTLARLPALRQSIETCITQRIAEARAALAVEPQWAALLSRAIAVEPAALVREGNVIATGYDSELDELRAIQENYGDVPDRAGGSRAKSNRYHDPQGGVQPRARFLYRDKQRQRRPRARRLSSPTDIEECRALHHA